MGATGRRDRGGVLIPRLSWVPFIFVCLLSRGVAAAPQQCPAGASWQGQPPPRGEGYSCAKPGPDGTLVRHGWTVQFDRLSTLKQEECEYLNGVRHGRCTFHDADGNRSERGYFENGKRAREWWFWTFEAPQRPGSGRTRVAAATSLPPGQVIERREDLQHLLLELGASEDDARGLTEHALNYVDGSQVKRRILCAATMCVGPGRAPDEPLYVKLSPTSSEVERDKDSMPGLLSRAQAASATERGVAEVAARKAEGDEKRKLKDYKAAVIRYEKLSRQWERTSLRCNDGARSPSCTCGGSWQGCCSWHGGVDGCPREEPTSPDPPKSMALESP